MGIEAFRYDGRRTLVIGAATGMGAATARAVASLGGEVIALDVAPISVPAKQTIRADLSQRASVDAALPQLSGPLHAVFCCACVVLLFRVTKRQRDEHLQVIRDIEVARVQGQRWRAESRNLLDGLGEAIEKQFSRWNLTEAEREVALLLLKGLSSKEVAAVRAVSERTVREQARAIYSKAGLSGRAALSAFFLEDLLAPIEGLD